MHGVYEEVQRGDEEEAKEITTSLSASIENIVENSTNHYKPLLAALQVRGLLLGY